MTRPRPAPARDLVARLPPARGPRLPASPSSPATCGTGWPPGRAAQARRNLRRVCQSLAASGRGQSAGPGRRHRPEGAGAPRPLRVPPRRALLPRGRPDAGASRRPSSTSGSTLDTPELIAEAVVPGQGRPLRRAPLRIASSWRSSSSRSGSARPSRRWRPSTTRACRPISSGRAAWPASAWSACARRAGSCSTRSASGIPVGLVGDRDLTGGGIPIPLFGAPAGLPMGPAMLAVESGRAGLRHDRPARGPRRVPAAS